MATLLKTTTEPAPPRSPRQQSGREIRVLRAALGAALGALAWLSLAALGGTLKDEALMLPLAPAAALAGALLASTRVRRVFWPLSVLAIGAAAVVAFTPLTSRVLPLARMIRNDSSPPRVEDPVVVLSGAVRPDSLLGPEALDRLVAGLELLSADTGSALVVTRARRPDARHTSADRDQRRLRALVRRDFPIFFADSVHTTHDEAVQVWKLLQPRRQTSITLVTSPLHTRRACGTFEHVGFRVTCIAAPMRGYTVRRSDLEQERLEIFRDWLYELAATMEYRWRGWL